LVAAMITLFLVLTIVLIGIAGTPTGPSHNGAMSTASGGMQMAFARTQSVTSFNLAESGVEYSLQWLHEQPSPPANTSSFAPSLWSGSTLGDREVVAVYNAINEEVGTFSIKIYPASGNPDNTQKSYIIESIGTSGGFSEILQVEVQQVSFGTYSYFSNDEYNNGYWVAGMNTFDGPLHSNSVDAYNPNDPTPVPTNILWYDTGNTQPMFTWDGPDAFSAVASSVGWNRDWIGNMSSPATDAEWLEVATGGASSITTGGDMIPLPTSSNTQETAALGGTAVPSTTGVVVPNNGTAATGGVYIHGNVNNMILSAPTSTSQKIEIDQTQANGYPLTTYVTENIATSQTTIVVDTTKPNGTVTATTNTYTGVTDGVVYSDGSIGQNGPPGQGLSGVVANNYTDANGNVITPNRLTIATDASQNIFMNGPLTLLTQRLQDSNGNPVPETSDTNYEENAATVGIVSDSIIVDDTTAQNQMLVNMQIDATVLAYNTIAPNNYGYNGALRGTFTVNGGYIADQEGIFGEIDWSGNMIEGFKEHYHYDPRLANNPPPYFPTTGSEYNVLSWQRVSKVLQ